MSAKATIRDARKPGWFYIDNSVIDQYGADIGAIGVAVYVALTRFANRDGQAFPAYQTIASNLKLARNTVISAIRRLEAAGLITIDPQTDSAGNRIDTNIYTLCAIVDRNEQKLHGGGAAVAPPSAVVAPPSAAVASGGSATAACEHDSTHGNSSSNRSSERKFLRKIGFYNGAINKVLELDIDWTTLEASIVALHSAGWGVGAIYNELQQNPPMKGQPYEQPQSGLGSPAAQAGAARPAPRSPERARRSAGSHNPTGGAELHNPGWMDREIAKVEAILAEERARAEL